MKALITTEEIDHIVRWFIFFDTGDDEDVGGTWVREGATLTLTGDDGTVLVLKEK